MSQIIDRPGGITLEEELLGGFGGFPDRGSSVSPARPCSANRDRHRITVGSLHPTRSAISSPGTPSAASSTIRARSTIRAGDPFDRVRRSSTTRCSSVNASVRTRLATTHCPATNTNRTTATCHWPGGRCQARRSGSTALVASRNRRL